MRKEQLQTRRLVIDRHSTVHKRRVKGIVTQN